MMHPKLLGKIPRIFSLRIEGSRCPYVNLAQKDILSALLKKCAEEIVKKPTARPPCTKVCQPAYPGWEGIAGNVLFQPEGYITVATFAAKGEFLFTLAPDSLMEECSGVQKILYALESAFGLRYFEVNFDLIADDQLQKAFSQLQSATYA